MTDVAVSADSGRRLEWGLRAVAISDTYSGVLLFGMALLVSFLALEAVGWNFASVPAERLTLIGDSKSLVPWPILFTGMILWQLYYWSTNQTITQRALASKSLREAQKGCYAAAVIRATLVPAIVVSITGRRPSRSESRPQIGAKMACRIAWVATSRPSSVAEASRVFA